MPFDVIENPITGERGMVRQAPTAEHDYLIADLYARPGAAVVGAHLHPGTTEILTVVRGRLGVRINGKDTEAGPGARITVPSGTVHDWWTIGDQTAWVIIEVTPGRRFEMLIRNLFFLAADGRTDSKGRPGLLQAALLAR